jgi:hypothetical protein
MKLSIADPRTSLNGQKIKFADFDAWKKPPPKRLSSYAIRCFIWQCKDIPSADDNGTSDPFITLWNQDERKIRTKTIEDNINPIYFETHDLFYDFDKLENAPPVIFNLWDSDGLLDKDDYLGRCVVYLNDCSISKNDTIPKPRWHNITFNGIKDEPACG